MSSRPKTVDASGIKRGSTESAPVVTPRPMSLTRLQEKRELGEPLVMVTAYDYPSASVAEAAGVDLVLVGDSAAMVVLGYTSTTAVTMDEMLILASAVRRGLKTPLLIGDMPFGSYEGSDELAIANAQRFVKEAGCDAVKLERGGVSARRAAAIIEAGIPVMAHVGLTPQSAVSLGGYRAQGRTAQEAMQVIDQALELQAAGCFAIVLEAVPSALTDQLMSLLEIPAIGIGAGPAADGQVLVFHDLLGIWDGRAAKFVKRYASLRSEMIQGVSDFAADVRNRSYPAPEHCYEMAPDEAALLTKLASQLAPQRL